MKKRWYLLLALPLVLGAPTMLSSCGDDEPDPIEKPNNPDTPNTPDTPDTGDRDPVSKVILLMCFAVVSVAGIVFYRKKFTGESK